MKNEKRSIENEKRIEILDTYLNKIHKIIVKLLYLDIVPAEIREIDPIHMLTKAITEKESSENELMEQRNATTPIS